MANHRANRRLAESSTKVYTAERTRRPFKKHKYHIIVRRNTRIPVLITPTKNIETLSQQICSPCFFNKHKTAPTIANKEGIHTNDAPKWNDVWQATSKYIFKEQYLS